MDDSDEGRDSKRERKTMDEEYENVPDTEPVLTAAAEMQSSCETFMSQQSDQEDPGEDYENLREGESPSLEEEANSSLDANMSNLSNGENIITSPRRYSSRKRKSRSDDESSLLWKKPRSMGNSSSEVSKGKESLEMFAEPAKKIEVFNISSTPEKTIIIDDSEEFSLRIEESSQPLSDQKKKLSQEGKSWDSHSPKEKNESSTHVSSETENKNSWSSHQDHNSWSSHNNYKTKFQVLQKKYDKLLGKLHKQDAQAEIDCWSTRGQKDFSREEEKLEDRLVWATVRWFSEGNSQSAVIVRASLAETQPPGEVPGRMSLTSSTTTTSAKSSSSVGSVWGPGLYPLPPRHPRLSTMSSVSTKTTRRAESLEEYLVVKRVNTGVPLSCGMCNETYSAMESHVSPMINGGVRVIDEVTTSEEEKFTHFKTPNKQGRPRKGRPPRQLPESSGPTKEEIPGPTVLPEAITLIPRKKPGRPKKKPEITPSPLSTSSPKEGSVMSTNLSTRTTVTSTVSSEKIRAPSIKSQEKVTGSTTSITPKNKARTRIEKGTAVFAKWGDGRYYPGWVSFPAQPTSSLRVAFCDGQSKAIKADKVRRADIVTNGSLVLVGTEAGEYDSALVVSVITEGEEPQYEISQDSTDATRRVPLAKIALLEAQILDEAQKQAAKINFNDLSLENLVNHPRKRTARLQFSESLESSLPASLKKRRREDKREREERLEAVVKPSTSHGKTGKGPEDYYVDTDSSTHSISSLSDLRGKEVWPLDAECTHTEQHDAGKLSGYRSDMAFKNKKHLQKQVEPESIVQAQGPIPPAGSDIFAGCNFLITYTTVVSWSEDLMIGTSEDASKLSAFTPVWRNRLRTQILKGGGKLYKDVSEVPKDEIANTYLITDKPSTTCLYLQCLVHNIHIYSNSVIIKCCTEKRPFKEVIGLRGTKRLMAGYSLAKQCQVPAKATQPFKGKTILLALSVDSSVTAFWETLVNKMGGKAEVYQGGYLDSDRFAVVVTDPGCDIDLIGQACDSTDDRQPVPLVSLLWLLQCIINDKFCSSSEKPQYKYDYILALGQESPEY